jgi:hypothetical protein
MQPFAHAQKYFTGRNEFGLVAGLSNYYGDLSQGQNLGHFHLSAGVFHKYNFSGYISNRIQVSYLKISGTDSGSESYAYRNLTFQSAIGEISEMIEFNFHQFGTNIRDKRSTPYAFFGVNAFVFGPRRLENHDIKLRPLRTNGHKYSYLQPSVTLGLGYKFMLTPRRNRGAWIIGLEGAWRKTFTDNLDDVSGQYPDYQEMVDNQGQMAADYSHAQTLNGNAPFGAGVMRGDPHLKDWYYFIGLSLSYRFTPYICR